jgi:hypothetical protein
MNKIITIDSSRYILPEGMTTKDIQALAGMLISLTKVEHCYLYPNYDSLFYAGEGVQVGVSTATLMTKEEARAKSEQSKVQEEARKAAEATGDLLARHVAS